MKRACASVGAGVMMATLFGMGWVYWLTAAGETSAPLPAPVEDRVGFPKGYTNDYSVLRTSVRSNEFKRVTVYGNAKAASITQTSQLPYPQGSVLVMETAEVVRDVTGQMVMEEGGLPRKLKVLGLHVMRREKDFGEAYGMNRTGEWEYVEYREDGSYITPPIQSGACAACHVKAGGNRDFVYRGRF